MIVTYQTSREVASYTFVLKGTASELELEVLKKQMLEILTPQPGKRVKLFLDCQEYVDSNPAGDPDA